MREKLLDWGIGPAAARQKMNPKLVLLRHVICLLVSYGDCTEASRAAEPNLITKFAMDYLAPITIFNTTMIKSTSVSELTIFLHMFSEPWLRSMYAM